MTGRTSAEPGRLPRRSTKPGIRSGGIAHQRRRPVQARDRAALKRSDVVVVRGRSGPWNRPGSVTRQRRDATAARLVPTTVDGRNRPLASASSDDRPVPMERTGPRGRDRPAGLRLGAIGAYDAPSSAEPREPDSEGPAMVAPIAVLVAAATGGGWWSATAGFPNRHRAIDAGRIEDRAKWLASSRSLGELQSARSDTFRSSRRRQSDLRWRSRPTTARDCFAATFGLSARNDRSSGRRRSQQSSR